MSLYVVDVEADGPIPNLYSMVCFGAVKLDEDLKTTFYGKTKPISKLWIPEALNISGFSREDHEKFDDCIQVMGDFKKWILETNNEKSSPIFVSDNNGFDWQWINYYFHYFIGDNPFGFSSRRIGDIYSGLTKDMRNASRWKKFKKTKHDHNPVNDALGNAEALSYMLNNLGLKYV